MEQEGLTGASMMSQFPGWGHYGYHWITNSHNIAGMLSESANAKLATPLYIHPEQLEGNHDKSTPFYGQQVHFTHPWPGGWWRLGDIVKRQYCAAYTVLDTMAKNRAQILFNMTQKALRQTQRGADSQEQAFLIPADQFDKGALRGLLNILLNQGIEVRQAAEEFQAGQAKYPAGTYVVPLAQPKMGVVMNLLGRTLYPDNFWTRDLSGAFTAFDTASDAAVSFISSLASSWRLASFQRMAAKPSGERIAYTAFSSISTRLATPRANAPPLLPSPVIMLTTGVRRRLISSRFRAMASPCPRSSASRPG
jgi:hypothetical protein